jgi:peptide/nickel transport system substrate-binding protein
MARRILFETHETLLLRNWDTCELEPDLCTSYDVEDTIRLKGESDPENQSTLFGAVIDDPAKPLVYTVRPIVRGARNDARDDRGARNDARDDRGARNDARDDSAGDFTVDRNEVAALERASVFTFHLRRDVKWQDGHPFDARDVAFSAGIYKNSFLECDEKRFQFDKLVKLEVLDPFTVRAFFDRQYFQALPTIGDMCILPSHLYDLRDPEHERYDPEYHKKRKAEDPKWTPTDEDEARYIATNPHNREWIGLGPYKIVKWSADAVEAVRFDGYFDKSRAGYLDAITWRAIGKDDVAFQALLNGELDFFARMSSDDYFGAATQDPTFTQRFYKGYVYADTYWYTAWNLRHPQFADVRVREALARLFDFDEFKRTYYRGLAEQVTGHASCFSTGYDHGVKAFPYSPDEARELLRAAGWYDHDGDGVIDKDGKPFQIELLSNAGNKTSEEFAAKLQEDLARAGIKLRYVPLEGATLMERRKQRDYDALALGWTLPYESDPEQVWHSRWAAPDKLSSNYTSLADPAVDAIIERGQRELDPKNRAAIWRELHAHLYALQPYMFGYNAPKKFALNKKIRGFQTVKLDPNYVIRRWYYPAGTPGTRDTPEAPK